MNEKSIDVHEWLNDSLNPEKSDAQLDIAQNFIEWTDKWKLAKTSNFLAAEKTIDDSQIWEFPKEFSFKWYDFVLQKNVFSPIYFKWSSVYVDHLPLHRGQSFLDMWCGCGVIWITACMKYGLDKVVCADINPYAVENTKENIKRYNLSRRYFPILWL